MAAFYRHRLSCFFLVAFVVAWGTWIPAFFIKGFPALFAMIGLFGPAIAAVTVATATGGRRGLAEIFGRFAIWRFNVKWYALTLALMPLAYAAGAISDVLFFRLSIHSMWTSGPAYYLVGSFIWLMAITAGEEIGWRGFALPLMLWHAPIFLSGKGSLPYSIFLLLAISLSFVYTALFLRSGGSLWPPIILHAATDFAPRIIHVGALTNTCWLIVSAIAGGAGLAMLKSLPVGGTSAAQTT